MPHLVRRGETLTSSDYAVFAGGKGGNQSIALARAGAKVFHAGKIGTDGTWLKEYLSDCGVDTSQITIGDVPTGHAVVQVAEDGANSIILFGGANHAIAVEDVKRVITPSAQSGLVLLQNELNVTEHIIREACTVGREVAFNPAPFCESVRSLPLHALSYLILNELEGAELSKRSAATEILDELTRLFPHTRIVLTLGENGVAFGEGHIRVALPGIKVHAVDTTAAGDTFIGFFLGGIARGQSLEASLEIANKAAALCVTRVGAGESIPFLGEL